MRQQERAKAVYEKVQSFKGELENLSEDEKKKKAERYGGMALKFPALLRSAGLMQAVAFVETRGKDEHKRFIQDFVDVLSRFDPEDTKNKNYFERIMTAELPEYMRITREALAIAEWFSRFAQSILKVKLGAEEKP